jgi:psp operon transcriptional activator
MNPNIEKQYSRATPARVTEALGQSEKFLEFQERLSRVAPVNRPVLLLGERGTGKELAAGRLHYLSERWHRPFLTLNCSALSPSLIESELFGYEKGAFTGAAQRRSGRFEAADGGTLFLDEIGNIPLEVQEKILRVVEYYTFERVGSSESIDVDVRIIAATNADLKTLVSDNRFKQDLLDRLCESAEKTYCCWRITLPDAWRLNWAGRKYPYSARRPLKRLNAMVGPEIYGS